MRNVSDKVVEKIKAHVLCSVTFLLNRALYEIMWTNIVGPDRPQMPMCLMRTSYAGYLRLQTHAQNM